MIKRRNLVRITRLWLALYVMTWCMTFTVSGVSSSYTDPLSLIQSMNTFDEHLIIGMIPSVDTKAGGSRVKYATIIQNNGTISCENVTLVISSSSPSGGGSITLDKYLGPMQIVNCTFTNTNNTATKGGAIYLDDSKVIKIDSSYIVNSKNQGGAVTPQYPSSSLNKIVSRSSSLSNITAGIEYLDNATSTEQIQDTSGYIVLSDVIGEVGPNNRSVGVLSINHLNPDETVLVWLDQTISQEDIDKGEIINSILTGGIIVRGGNENTTLLADPFITTGMIRVPTTYSCNITFDTETGILPDYIRPIPINYTTNPDIIENSTIPLGHEWIPDNLMVHSGTPIAYLPIPEKDGLIFLGWYTAPSGGNRVYWTTAFNKNTTLYARWGKIIQPEVTFNPALLPATGDRWNIWVYAGLGFLAVTGIILLMRRRK